MYQLDILTCLRTCLDVEHRSDLLDILSHRLRLHLSIVVQVGLSPDKEEYCLFVGILSCLAYPSVQTVKTFLGVDSKREEDSADAFIEGSHDGSKGLLPSLGD